MVDLLPLQGLDFTVPHPHRCTAYAGHEPMNERTLKEEEGAQYPSQIFNVPTFRT